jgi:hypothetical protein
LKAQYRGWIPTVTGRLSFSHFGDAKRIKSVRRADTRKRYLIAYQNRKTGDALLPVVLQWIARVGSRAHFVCVAETVDVASGVGVDGQGVLRGKIFIANGFFQCRRLRQAIISPCFESLANFDQHSGTSIENHFSAAYQNLIMECAIRCSFQIDFQLARTGIADFQITEGMVTRADAPQLDQSNAQRITFGLAHQCYSFLKDLGHHHKHHSPRNDTIVDLHDFDNSDDKTWRRKTLYGIYRRIITCMRREEIVQQISSVGLLAYAKTFKSIWLESYPDDEKGKEIPIFYDEHMEESIRAAETRMRFKTQERSEQKASFRTVLFSGVGLVLSIAGLVKITSGTQITEPAASYLVTLAGWLLKFPLEILLPILAVAYFWNVVWPRHLRPQRWRALKVLQALVQPFNRFVSVAIIWLIGLLLLIGGTLLIFGM